MYQELRKVLQYIVDQLTINKLANTYSLLSQQYQQLLTAPSPAVDEQIINLTKAITEQQTEIEPDHFDNRSLQIFRKFDQENLLGAAGLITFQDTLNNISNNPHAVSVALAEIANKITAIQTKAQQAYTNLSDIWGTDTPEASKETEIQIIFDDKVAIDNIENLQTQAKFWSENLKLAKTMLVNGREEPKIVSIYKSSPTEIILRGDWATLMVMAVTFKGALEIVKRILDIIETGVNIKKLALETKRLEVLQKTLDEGIKETLDKQIETTVHDVINQMGDVIPKKEERNISISAGRKLIANIYNFTNNGGVLSVVNKGTAQKDTKIDDGVYSTIENSKELTSQRIKLHNPILPAALVSPKEEVKPKKQTKAEKDYSKGDTLKHKRKYTKRIKVTSKESEQQIKSEEVITPKSSKEEVKLEVK